MLIVGGAFAILQRVLLAGAGRGVSGGPVVEGLLLALDLATIAVGLLARSGRAWVVDVNLVAISAFLYLTALPRAVALFYGLLYGLVLVALLVHRPWFDAVRAWRSRPVRPTPLRS